MTEFFVVPTEIERHAQDVTAVAGQVAQAQAAAGTVTALSPSAFGLLCGFFTPPVLTMSTAAIASMTASSGVLGTYAATLPVVAGDFENTDVLVAQSHTEITGKLA